MSLDLLKKFVHDNTRLALAEPFSRGQFTYATDTHAMIRLPRLDGVKEKASPNPEFLFENIDKERPTQWIPFPSLVPQQYKPCEHCEASGVEPDECDVCDGTGEQECDLGHWHDCSECDGAGKLKTKSKEQCSVCKGTCKEPAFTAVEVADGVHVQRHLLARFDGLEGLTVRVVNDVEPVEVRFNGGCGVVMPCRI